MELTIGSTTRPYAGLSFEEACARIAAAGYTDVAVFANQVDGERVVPVRAESSAEDVAAAKKAAADAGVTPSMVLARAKLELGVDGAVADYKKLIDNSAEVGASWLLELGTSKEEFYDTYYEVMAKVSPHAEAAGIGLSMKPHGGISLTTEHLMAGIARVDHPAFRICYDPGNIIYYTKGDMRPEDDIDDVAPQVSTGIIKDCVIHADGRPDVMVTAGDGLVDFYRILSGLIGGGFDGPLYVECVGSSEPDAVDRDLAFTLGYVKGILTGL